MADYTITATQVKHVSGPKGSGVLGETATRGMPIYLDATTGKLLKAVATSAAASDVEGLLLADGSDGSHVAYAKDGAVVDLGAGAAVPAGKILVLSGTAGGISPHTDATTPATGEFATTLGNGIGNNRVQLKFCATKVAAA